jgi:hypothetical protein
MLFLLILLISFVLQQFMPWWIIVPVAFSLGAWRGKSAFHAFISGFGAIATLWAIAALVVHLRTEGILTGKIAQLFFLPLPELMIAATALIGGLAGGIAALSGFYWKNLFSKKVPAQ